MTQNYIIISLLVLFSFNYSKGQNPKTDNTEIPKVFPSLVLEETPTKTAQDFMNEAIAHFDGRRYQQCIGLLNQALAVNQEGRLSDILYYYRAISNLNLQNYPSAIADLDTAIVFNNSKPHYFYHRGDAYFKLEQYNLAFEDLKMATQLEPNYEPAWMEIGLISQQNNNLREALMAYNKVISLNEKNSEAYYYRGLLMLQVGMPDKGCSDLEKASNLGLRLAEKAKSQYCR